LGEGLTRELSYKMLGYLTKAYICISTDDGLPGLGSYTIPMAIQKDIPITACIPSNAGVFNDYSSVVMDAYENHGLCIAQHDVGNGYWDNKSEEKLRNFIKSEKEAFTTMGYEVYGAAIPAHRTNYLVEALFGSEYEVVRCGYDGFDSQGNKNYHTIHDYSYALSPARANMFCLASENCIDKSLNYWKGVIDYAVENKQLVNIYIHDVNFTEGSSGYEANRTLLEAVIDYAKTKDITFITFKDIPHIY
jgi:hypothetical protein